MPSCLLTVATKITIDHSTELAFQVLYNLKTKPTCILFKRNLQHKLQTEKIDKEEDLTTY